MSWLLNTQLCPLIWALILGLLAALVYKVCLAQSLFQEACYSVYHLVQELDSLRITVRLSL